MELVVLEGAGLRRGEEQDVTKLQAQVLVTAVLAASLGRLRPPTTQARAARRGL